MLSREFDPDVYQGFNKYPISIQGEEGCWVFCCCFVLNNHPG